MKNQKNIITVEALKYDRKIHRSWQVELLYETPEFWKLIGTFDREITHPLLGVIRRGAISVEYYWKEKCFNVFAFYEPEGNFRNFYCNINLPPTLENDVLRYIDLDIDVLVKADLSYEVVDLEEFAENSQKYSYPPEVIEKANGALEELCLMIKNKAFPFNKRSATGQHTER